MTRIKEGCRSYGSFFKCDGKCKRRGINPWDYIAKVIASARKGINPPCMQAVQKLNFPTEGVNRYPFTILTMF